MKSIAETNDLLKQFLATIWLKIRNLLFDDWIFKLIALVIAIILWYVVTKPR